MYWQKATHTVLAPFSDHTRTGLITDMDGTISYFAAEPHSATITPKSRSLLIQLSKRLSLVAVISGRTVLDVREKVGLEKVQYIGNHGLEMWSGGKVQITPEAAAYRSQLQAALEAVQRITETGMLVEDKGVTLSIHYRSTENPEMTRKRLYPLMQEITSETGLVLFEGHRIFEVRPPIAIDKGTAFRELVFAHRLEAAMFIGDDTTDVAALEMAQHMRSQGTCYAVGIGVESPFTPAAVLEAADLLADGVPGVEALLSWLAEARIASST